MRYVIFLITLFSACGLCAGTYQDKAGNRIPLKTKDGNDHPFNGHLAPFSNQQNVDLSDADFSPIPRIKEQGIKADPRLTRMHSQMHSRLTSMLTSMRNRAQSFKMQTHKSEAEINELKKRGAEIDRQIKALRNKQDEPDKVKAQLTMLHKQRKVVFTRINRDMGKIREIHNAKKRYHVKKHNMEKQIEQMKTAIALAEGAAADLRGVNLRGANLENANLDYALLEGANLSEAKLESANLDGATMAEVNLAKADLTGASLVATELSDANLRNVEFCAANLKDATLRRVYLRGAGIYEADFTNTDLTGAVLRDIDGWDEAVWAKAYYQATDSPWWPEGMDPIKLHIREVVHDKSGQDNTE